MNSLVLLAQWFVVLSLLCVGKLYARPQLVPGSANIEVAFEGRPTQGRVYVIRGESIRLRCTSSLSNLAWRFVPSYIASAGKEIGEVAKAMQGQMIESEPERNYYANRLSIDNVTEKDTGTYFCFARDANQFSRIPVNVIDWSDVVEGELLRGPKLSPDNRLYAELLCRQKLPDPLPVRWLEGDDERTVGGIESSEENGETISGQFGEKLTIDKDLGENENFEADYTCQVDTSHIAPDIRISVTFGIRHSAKDNSIDIFITKTSGRANDGKQLPAPFAADAHHHDDDDDAARRSRPAIVNVPPPPPGKHHDDHDDEHRAHEGRHPDDDEEHIIDGLDPAVDDEIISSTTTTPHHQHHNQHLVKFPVVKRVNCTQTENGTTECEEVPVDADETVEYVQPGMST